MPRGTGSPGSVTSTAAVRSSTSSSLASRRSRSATCRRSSSPRTRFSSCPRAPRSSAGRAPSSRRASVSALERPSASTRASSSSRPSWPARAARAPALEGGGVLHCHPRVDAGTRELPRGTTLLAPHSGASRFRPFDGVSTGSGGELRRIARAGALSHGPAPCADSARLLVSVGAGAAILPRATSAAAPGGEPYEQLGSLYDRWCAGVDHDIAFYVLACEGAAGPIMELGAGSGRIAVELARHGHRVVALDASPAMLAQARRRARRLGVDGLLETVLGDLRDPPALPHERPRDRSVPDVHAPVRRRRAAPRP